MFNSLTLFLILLVLLLYELFTIIIDNIFMCMIIISLIILFLIIFNYKNFKFLGMGILPTIMENDVEDNFKNSRESSIDNDMDLDLISLGKTNHNKVVSYHSELFNPFDPNSDIKWIEDNLNNLSKWTPTLFEEHAKTIKDSNLSSSPSLASCLKIKLNGLINSLSDLVKPRIDNRIRFSGDITSTGNELSPLEREVYKRQWNDYDNYAWFQKLSDLKRSGDIKDKDFLVNPLNPGNRTSIFDGFFDSDLESWTLVKENSPKFSLEDPRLKLLCLNKELPPLADPLQHIGTSVRTLKRYPKYDSLNKKKFLDDKELPKTPIETIDLNNIDYDSLEEYIEYLKSLLLN